MASSDQLSISSNRFLAEILYMDYSLVYYSRRGSVSDPMAGKQVLATTGISHLRVTQNERWPTKRYGDERRVSYGTGWKSVSACTG